MRSIIPRLRVRKAGQHHAECHSVTYSTKHAARCPLRQTLGVGGRNRQQRGSIQGFPCAGSVAPRSKRALQGSDINEPDRGTSFIEESLDEEPREVACHAARFECPTAFRIPSFSGRIPVPKKIKAAR